MNFHYDQISNKNHIIYYLRNHNELYMYNLSILINIYGSIIIFNANITILALYRSPF